MWKDEEGVEKKLDMGLKLAVEAEPGKPNEEDPFAKVPTSMATYRNFEVRKGRGRGWGKRKSWLNALMG